MDDIARLVLTRKQFTKFAKSNRSDVTKAGFCRKDGGFGENGNTACHAGIRSYGQVGDLAIYSQHQGPVKKDKNIDTFYHYLMYESPWSSIFVKPKVKDVVQDAKENGLILSTNHPNNMVAQACFASRLATENKDRVVAFSDLYKAFGNKDLAFLVASFTVKSGDGFTFTSNKGGHFHFNSGLSKKYVENFLKHKYRKGTTTIKKPRYEYTVNDSFSKDGGDYLLDFLRKFDPKKGIEIKLNIFDTKPKPKAIGKTFRVSDIPQLVKYVEEEFL